ncbi:MAG: hypothetical protein Rubg2KO_00570 [Rubricoccaceae bacterium]
MDWRDYIDSNPNVLVGKPRLKGTRISVDLILRITSAGWTREQILDSYPHLTDEMVRAVYAYAADAIEADAVRPVAA